MFPIKIKKKPELNYNWSIKRGCILLSFFYIFTLRNIKNKIRVFTDISL